MLRCALCGTTPAAICYWTAVFIPTWLVLTLGVGHYWPVLRENGGATIVLAAGLACLANYTKNCTYHCRVTGPLFLVLGALALLNPIGSLVLPGAFFWAAALIGTAAALLLEWRYTRVT